MDMYAVLYCVGFFVTFIVSFIIMNRDDRDNASCAMGSFLIAMVWPLSLGIAILTIIAKIISYPFSRDRY